MSENVQLIYGGKTYEFPVYTGTENEKAIDIGKLRSQTGLITLDEGFRSTGSTYSAITFIDGELGILRYRGYPIEELAEKASFLEVSYLLIYGELPSGDDLQKFTRDITNHTLVHEDIKRFLDGYPSNSHPMGQLCSLICSLASFYPESLIPNRGKDEIDLTIIRLMAKMPTLASWIYKKSKGHPIIYPSNNLNYSANFLKMMFGHRTEEYFADPVLVDAMDKLLILHADHEQNCSTATVRMVGSSHASLFASIAAGIAALWGPRHGGANQAVLEMLDMINADGGNVQKWIDKAKDKNSDFLLMGFGHRVYKNFDPRAKIIKNTCDNVLKRLEVNDPVLEIALKLEEAALKDDYFVQRKLYPNVDFYSGIIYKAMGFSTEMFTVLFALGRLPGWIAQWREMMLDKQEIARPRQLYMGPSMRSYVPIDKR